ncbi:MAG: hypothetical protein, partial [Olavius algarvensis Gamma 1 endosymbiont]
FKPWQRPDDLALGIRACARRITALGKQRTQTKKSASCGTANRLDTGFSPGQSLPAREARSARRVVRGRRRRERLAEVAKGP